VTDFYQIWYNRYAIGGRCPLIS